MNETTFCKIIYSFKTMNLIQEMILCEKPSQVYQQISS